MPDLFPDRKPVASCAVISQCGVYRYRLDRVWDASIPPLCWIMLNPSTADAEADDPTIRKVAYFTRAFGFGGLRVVNLYALRATDPRELWQAAEPVGPDNDQHIIDAVAGEMTVLAWGANAKPDRVRKVCELIQSNALGIDCLGVTKGGMPRHPLYLPNAATREPWRPSDCKGVQW